ncbi:DUF3445 domain-containing protein [Rhodophyticola sp. CCM32]|nr:DUF3445 domain-containing protein [Rhodophyticola sp. CCM32]
MAPVGRRLPGVQPLADGADWLMLDEVYADQMALRLHLTRVRPRDVIAALPGAGDAIEELYQEVLGWCDGRQGFHRHRDRMHCPDGRAVSLKAEDRLSVIAHLVQEDICLLQKPDGAGEHILTAAILCFPASWTLAEKIGHPLGAIHRPVAPYDADMAPRVQRLFDHLHCDRPLWRQNALLYENPALYQPRRAADPRRSVTGPPGFLRSERQVMRRLPRTGAIVFSIHSWVVPLAGLTREQQASLDELRQEDRSPP